MISILLAAVSLFFFCFGVVGFRIAVSKPITDDSIVPQLFIVSALFAIAAGVWR